MQPLPEDLPWLRQALTLAHRHMQAGAGGPFGAVVVRDGRPLGEGWNQVTSTNDPTAHAEIVAIRAAARSTGAFTLTGAVLYTSCEPCPMCLAAAYWARLDRIVFAGSREDAAAADFDDAWIYREVALPAAERRLPMQQALRAEAQSLFQSWLAKPDRIPY